MSTNRAYGDGYPQLRKKYPTAKELEQKFDTGMNNKAYSHVMNNYLLCVTAFLNQFDFP